MEHESILQIGTDVTIPRSAYNKRVMVKFLNKCEWQNRFNPDNKVDLVLYMDGSEINTGTDAGVYKWRSRMGHSFHLWLHSTVFLAEIHTIKVCILENIHKGYTGKNIYSFCQGSSHQRP
jgi:hypothetical protein